jgi:hypothetical protein
MPFKLMKKLLEYKMSFCILAPMVSDIENLIQSAVIINNKHRANGYPGMDTIIDSQSLGVSDPDNFKRIAKSWEIHWMNLSSEADLKNLLPNMVVTI